MNNLAYDVSSILHYAASPDGWSLTSARTFLLATGMGVANLHKPAGQIPAVADDLVRTVAGQDECAVVISETNGGAAAMLDRLQDELSRRRVRCIRISMPPLGSLSLRGLMAQILGRPEPSAFQVLGRPEFAALTDGELKAGFTALTEPGAGYDRVALLIDGAHSLQLPVLRYIQFACQSSPSLRVVLTGRPALDSLLSRNEFGLLNLRIRHRFELAGSSLAGLAMKSAPSDRGRRAPPRWLTYLNTGLGALASSALIASLALWVLPTGHSPEPPAPPLPGSAGVASDRVASAPEADRAAPTPEASVAPLATWTRQPADAPEPVEAPTPSSDLVPAVSHDVTPRVTVSDAPPAEPLPIPDQPLYLDPPPAEPMPEVHVADLESELAGLHKIEPAPADHLPGPIVPSFATSGLATSGLAASSLAVPGRSPAQSPPSPMRHIAAARKQATAPDEDEGGRRCRDIVLNAQLGRTPSHADTLFMQNGCRNK